MRLPTATRLAGLGLLTTTMLCTTGTAFAQDPPADPNAPPPVRTAPVQDDTDIVVTATRRAENLQDVPIAITAMGTETLDELQVDEFNDYARLVPSLSFRSLGPGSANVYFRGVASGENANHSASLPSVGTYLDEQPITTITGALDLHIFDIARVEALAGPQGTLYGASSQAGTVRIITNQPDTSELYGEVGARAEHTSPMAISAAPSRASSTRPSPAMPRCAWSPGTGATPAISTTSRARSPSPPPASPSPTRLWSRRIITTSRPTAPARRCASSSTTIGR